MNHNENNVLLNKFQRLIFLSGMDWLEEASIATHDFEGVLGMEAQQNLLNPMDAVVKRTMDILVSLILGLFFLLISILIALWFCRFSLDDIPQLINILKGEMSLVGPRPIILEQ